MSKKYINPVTLQINVAPGDYRHCQYLLRKQLELFSQQVSEILITYDSKPRKIQNIDIHEKNKMLFDALFTTLKRDFPSLRVHEIDYSPETTINTYSKYFGKSIPTHDYRGAPVYGYIYGIEEAKEDFVVHIDSDMFFGGLSQTWVTEALELMKSNENVLVTGPLPGPPHPEKKLVGQSRYFAFKPGDYHFGFYSMSTRIFMLNKKRLYGMLKPHKPAFQQRVFGMMEGFDSLEALEIIISNFMKSKKLIRVDFKGKQPGLWSIHPTYRSEEFYNRIPEMIERVINNDVPEEQLGYYNFSMNFIDWSEALKNFEKNRLRNKVLRKFYLAK